MESDALHLKLPEKQGKMLSKLVNAGKFRNKQEAVREAIRIFLFGDG